MPDVAELQLFLSALYRCWIVIVRERRCSNPLVMYEAHVYRAKRIRKIWMSKWFNTFQTPTGQLLTNSPQTHRYEKPMKKKI